MKSVYTAKSNLFIVFVMLIAACSNIIIDPYYLENGIDITKISVLTAQYMYVFIVIDVISSYVFDKISKRLSVFLCFLFSAISFYIMGLASGPHFFAYILVSTFFTSAGNAFLSGASGALIIEEIDDPKNIKQTMAKMNIAVSVASLVGYCIGLGATTLLSYRSIIYISATLVLIVSPFTMVFLKKNKHKEAIRFSWPVIKRDFQFTLIVIFGGRRCYLTILEIIMGILGGTLSLYFLYLLNPKAAVLIVFLNKMLDHILGILHSQLSLKLSAKQMQRIGLLLAVLTLAAVVLRFVVIESAAERFVILGVMILSGSASFYLGFPMGVYFQRRISDRLRSTVISNSGCISTLVYGALLPVLGFLYKLNGRAILLGLAIGFVVVALIIQLPQCKPKDFYQKVA